MNLRSSLYRIARALGDLGKIDRMLIIHADKYGFEVDLPEWFGDKDFHRSHASNLIRKNPEHYRPIFGDDVPDDLPYIWPVK